MDDGPELLTTMNECIVANKSIGLYDGCKNAIRLAQELASKKDAPKRSAASPRRR